MEEIKNIENEDLKDVSGGQASNLTEDPSIDLVTQGEEATSAICKPRIRIPLAEHSCKPNANCLPKSTVV